MLATAIQISELVFNVLSSLGIIAAVVWFFQKKKFDSQIHVESAAVYLTDDSRGDRIVRYALRIRNLSERQLYVNHVFLSAAYAVAPSVKTGNISEQDVTAIPPLIELNKGYFIIVSGAESPVSALVVVPREASLLVVKWYLIPGEVMWRNLIPRKRPRINVSTIEEVEAIINDDYPNWFFDLDVIAMDQLRERIAPQPAWLERTGIATG